MSNLKIDEIKENKIENLTRFFKATREYYKMTQKEFANFIGIKPANYSQIEMGNYTPSLTKLLEICEILKCTLDDIFFNENVFISKFNGSVQENIEKLTPYLFNFFKKWQEAQNMIPEMSEAMFTHNTTRFIEIAKKVNTTTDEQQEEVKKINEYLTTFISPKLWEASMQ